MKLLYNSEFLKQKMPSLEEYNKRFGPRYRGFEYFFEEANRWYHVLDRAKPIAQEENEFDNYHYIFNAGEPRDTYEDYKKREEAELLRQERLKMLKKRRILRKILKLLVKKTNENYKKQLL